MRIIAHSDDCPALVVIPGELHACTCAAAAQLADLVEAAESARSTLTDVDGYDLSKDLDAALRPFREAK
jgi:hypothetical protein